jgi:hypothetical protein
MSPAIDRQSAVAFTDRQRPCGQRIERIHIQQLEGGFAMNVPKTGAAFGSVWTGDIVVNRR